MTKTALVVSAHSADFVWRAGGAIALHAARGYAMHVVCLSFGERGESEKLWRQKGTTLEAVKAARRKEAESAAEVLGVAQMHFFDMGDYPMRVSEEALYRLVAIFRNSTRPSSSPIRWPTPTISTTRWPRTWPRRRASSPRRTATTPAKA